MLIVALKTLYTDHRIPLSAEQAKRFTRVSVVLQFPAKSRWGTPKLGSTHCTHGLTESESSAVVVLLIKIIVDWSK